MKDNIIVKLTGPERIRKRPAVLFLSDDLAGAEYAVRILLNIFVSEAQLGYCSSIAVKQNGSNLEISGDDRGIYLGQDTGDDMKWKNIFCSLDLLPACPPDESGYSFGLMDYSHNRLYGDDQAYDSIFFPDELGYMELYAVQCASAYVDVLVNRNGIHSELHFARGYHVGGMDSKPTTENNGTRFRFSLDREVFTQTEIPSDFFLETLKAFSVLCPGLKCSYTNTDGLSETFYYPNGLLDYVQFKQGENAVPVFCKKINAKGRDRYNWCEYEACVDVAIGYTPDAGSIKCFHNFRMLTYGGSHLEELKKQICRGFNVCYSTPQIELRDFDEIEKHLTIILATWCSPRATVWGNGMRLSIQNRMIEDMTYDAVGSAFCDYLYQQKEHYRNLLDVIRLKDNIFDRKVCL